MFILCFVIGLSMHDHMECHSGFLGGKLNDYRNNQMFCDVILKCDDDTEFPAHRVVLAAMSEYFHTSFCGSFVDSNSKVYKLNGVEAKNLSCLLDYFYTGRIKITTSNIVELLQTADFLLVTPLKEMCRKFMMSDLKSTTLIRYQFLAKQYFDSDMAPAEDLTKQGFNFYDIFEDDFLLQLSFLQVKELLQDKFLKHVQEKLVLNFVFKWVDVCTERQTSLVELLGLVAWEYVPPTHLNKALDMIYDGNARHPVTRKIIEQLEKFDTSQPIPAVHIIRSRAASTVCYAFFPALDKWVSLAPIPSINISGCILKTTTLCNKLYVLCCKDQFASRIHHIRRSYFLCYEPMSNQWTQLPCPLGNNDEDVCIPAMFLFSSQDSVFYINTYTGKLLQFCNERSKWKEIKLNCDRFHKDSHMFIKVYNGVLYILGLNVYRCTDRYTLVSLKLSNLSSSQVRLQAFYQRPDGVRLPQDAWQDDCPVKLSTSLKIQTEDSRQKLRLYNEYQECVCSVDMEEGSLVFYHNKRAEYFSKKSWQALGWGNQVFLASSIDRSCAILDTDTGFWKYVDENPLFPHWTHQAFVMSQLNFPHHVAKQSSM